MLNTATLTGKRLLYPLHIFAVNDIGTFHDVTHMTACHSSDRDVLKVGHITDVVFQKVVFFKNSEPNNKNLILV